MARPNKRAELTRDIAAQEAWIAEHGGDVQGYIVAYGATNAPGRTGDGGEAIYRSDREVLDRLQARLAALPEPEPQPHTVPFAQQPLKTRQLLTLLAVQQHVQAALAALSTDVAGEDISVDAALAQTLVEADIRVEELIDSL